jgi:hypothetical protein
MKKLHIPAVLTWTALGGAALGAAVACGGTTVPSPTCETCHDAAVADRMEPAEAGVPDGSIVDEGIPPDVIII